MRIQRKHDEMNYLVGVWQSYTRILLSANLFGVLDLLNVGRSTFLKIANFQDVYMTYKHLHRADPAVVHAGSPLCQELSHDYVLLIVAIPLNLLKEKFERYWAFPGCQELRLCVWQLTLDTTSGSIQSFGLGNPLGCFELVRFPPPVFDHPGMGLNNHLCYTLCLL